MEQNMKVRIIVIYAIPLKKNIFIALDLFKIQNKSIFIENELLYSQL